METQAPVTSPDIATLRPTTSSEMLTPSPNTMTGPSTGGSSNEPSSAVFAGIFIVYFIVLVCFGFFSFSRERRERRNF